MVKRYDAGLLSDYGGGNVEWWQDYLRAEIERCNDHWEADYAALEAKVRRLEGATTDAINDLSDAEGRQSVHEMRNWVLQIMDNLKIARRALKEE
jgi:hypothetical protein